MKQRSKYIAFLLAVVWNIVVLAFLALDTREEQWAGDVSGISIWGRITGIRFYRVSGYTGEAASFLKDIRQAEEIYYTRHGSYTLNTNELGRLLEWWFEGAKLIHDPSGWACVIPGTERSSISFLATADGFYIDRTGIATTNSHPIMRRMPNSVAATGWVLRLLGAIMWLFGGCWFVVVAFRESVRYGLGMLFCFPMVAPMSVMLNFAKAWRPALTYLIGVFMLLLGSFVLGPPTKWW